MQFLKNWFKRRRLTAFDRRYGTDTLFESSEAEMPKVRSRLGDNFAHSTLKFVDDVEVALNHFPASISEYSFIDLGCGKGRALMLAAQYPFSRVIGIEIDPEIAAVARTNVGLFRRRKCDAAPIDVQQADAADIELPDGNVVVYLYNPFGAETARSIVEKIASHSDDAILLYVKPTQAQVCDEVLAPCPEWPLVSSMRAWRNTALNAP